MFYLQVLIPEHASTTFFEQFTNCPLDLFPSPVLFTCADSRARANHLFRAVHEVPSWSISVPCSICRCWFRSTRRTLFLWSISGLYDLFPTLFAGADSGASVEHLFQAVHQLPHVRRESARDDGDYTARGAPPSPMVLDHVIHTSYNNWRNRRRRRKRIIIILIVVLMFLVCDVTRPETMGAILLEARYRYRYMYMYMYTCIYIYISKMYICMYLYIYLFKQIR